MPEYSADEWFPQKGTYTLKVNPRHMVDIWVSCSKTVSVFGLQGAATTLLKSGEEFRFRGQVKGFQKILVKGTGQTLFGLKIRHSPIQEGEFNSGEKAPIIDLPEPSNLVQKMRQMAASHHAMTRMPVLEPEDGPSFNRYEFDDDVEVLFEEEALEKAVADKKAAAKKAKEDAAAAQKAEAASTSEPGATASERQKAPPGGAEPKSGESPPSTATAAE